MKAVRYERYGGPEVMTLTDIPVPEPKPGRVRVRVHAVGVNPADWKMREGMFNPGKPAPDKPRGIGLELAGVVDAVGEPPDSGQSAGGGQAPGGEEPLHVGDLVFGSVGSGAAAEYAIAKPENLVRKPDWLTYERAAALPVASEAAYRTVIGHLGVEKGHILLMHAASGSVGLVASQLAIARGARVIGTASEPRFDFLRGIGVEPVAYGEGWEKRVAELAPTGVDRVLDASGRGVLPGSVRLAGTPEHVVTIADMASAEENDVQFSSSGSASMHEVFDTILPLLADGKVIVPVHRTFRLDEIVDAHRSSEHGHHLGKLVLSLP